MPVVAGRRVRGRRRSSGSRCGRRGRRRTGAVALGDGARRAARGASARVLAGRRGGRDRRRGRGVATSGFAAPASPRYVLRDVVIPPFDVREYPSPLQSFRALRARLRRRAAVHRVGPARRRPRAPRDHGRLRRHRLQRLGRGRRHRRARSSRCAANMSADAEGTPATRARRDRRRWQAVWMPEAGAVTQRRRSTATAPTTCAARRTTTRRRETGVVTAQLARGRRLHARRSSSRPSAATRALADVAVRAGADAEAGRRARRTSPRSPSKAVAEAATPDRAGAGAADHAVGGRLLQPRPRGRGALARRPRRRAHLDAARLPSRWSATTSSTPSAMALLAGELGIPARVVMGFYPDEDAAGDAGLHRDRRHAARVGRGRVRGRRLGAVRPDAARGSGSERPDHEAARRPEAAGAAAAASAAGARRPAADRARRPRVRGRRGRRRPASWA